jgi:hypothetical protein
MPGSAAAVGLAGADGDVPDDCEAADVDDGFPPPPQAATATATVTAASTVTADRGTLIAGDLDTGFSTKLSALYRVGERQPAVTRKTRRTDRGRTTRTAARGTLPLQISAQRQG